jgi:hypothetical protein
MGVLKKLDKAALIHATRISNNTAFRKYFGNWHQEIAASLIRQRILELYCSYSTDECKVKMKFCFLKVAT